MKKRRRFTAEKKAQIVLEVLEVLRENSTLAEVANEYGLHQAQLSKWKQEFLLNMPMIFKNQQNQRGTV
jgi:putative transposase